MPLGTEIELGPDDIVLDGNPASPTERSTVHLCGFRHVSTSGLDAGAIVGRRLAPCSNLLRQMSRLWTIRVALLDVKRRSSTLFPILPKTGSSF